MDGKTRCLMRGWLIRFHKRSQKGETFTAGEWEGRDIVDCIYELDDTQLQSEWGSYQC